MKWYFPALTAFFLGIALGALGHRALVNRAPASTPTLAPAPIAATTDEREEKAPALEVVHTPESNPLTASTPRHSLHCAKRTRPEMSCFDEAEWLEARVEIMRAKDLYEDLCGDKKAERGGEACYRLGAIHRDSGSEKKMDDYFGRACSEHGYDRACRKIKIVARARARIARNLEDCAGSNLRSCHRIGTTFRETADLSRAIRNLIPACQGGYARSCVALAEIARASESPVEAKVRFQKACDMKDKSACATVALLP